jgi:transposase
MEGKEVADDVGLQADIVGGASVTVPRSGQGAEAEVVGKERWEEIRRLREAGQSVSAIARRMDVDRKTVRNCLKKSGWAPYRREPKPATLLSPHLEWLQERAPQVRYSARILYQELKAQRGYGGGYDTVKVAVRPWRAEASLASLTQRRFETGPGQQAQVDWGQVKVRFAEGPAEVHVFVMTLGYSRRAYGGGFRDERLATLLEAHERAFAHFGGRCPGPLASGPGQRPRASMPC